MSTEKAEENDDAAPSTLAVQVRAIFSRLAEQAGPSSAAKPISLLECWSQTLHGQGPQDAELFELLAAVSAQVRRLMGQVKDSRILRRDGKRVATEVVTGLSSLLRPELFHRPVHDFRDNFSADRLGTLEMLAEALKQENPEALLSKTDLETLTKDVEALVAKVNESDISPDLKALLMRHASFMAWAVHNIAFVGFQGVYEAIARMMVTAQRLPADSATINQSSDAELGLKAWIFGKCQMFYRMLRGAEAIEKDIEAIEHIVESGGKLLEAIESLADT